MQYFRRYIRSSHWQTDLKVNVGPCQQQLLPLSPLDGYLDNDAGSKRRREAAADALGLDVKIRERGLMSPAGLYGARESPGNLVSAG